MAARLVQLSPQIRELPSSREAFGDQDRQQHRADNEAQQIISHFSKRLFGKKLGSNLDGADGENEQHEGHEQGPTNGERDSRQDHGGSCCVMGIEVGHLPRPGN
ncbi:MAG: hypothetical protein AAGG06_09730 [Pseudomonadota bacterium]